MSIISYNSVSLEVFKETAAKQSFHFIMVIVKSLSLWFLKVTKIFFCITTTPKIYDLLKSPYDFPTWFLFGKYFSSVSNLKRHGIIEGDQIQVAAFSLEHLSYLTGFTLGQ